MPNDPQMLSAMLACRQSQPEQAQHRKQQPYRPVPGDDQLTAMLQRVQLGHILQRQTVSAPALDSTEDWASILSLGEQQRLAFARCCCSCAFACSGQGSQMDDCRAISALGYVDELVFSLVHFMLTVLNLVLPCLALPVQCAKDICLADQQAMLHCCMQLSIHCCRVLLSAPKLVLMDESTSALDTGNEALMYRLLKDSGITYVSIGHRPTLVNFHDQVLRLQPSIGNGSQASFEILDAQTVKRRGVMADA